MSTRFFSVIIPTRERADTLAASLRSVSSQDYDHLEIIVSDNCSLDNTQEVVRSFDDPRIKYINTGHRVSMSENWEFALSHVSGDWVTIIGDDDALMPGCLTKVNAIAESTGVKAIRSETCYYYWPGLAGTPTGMLKVPMSAGYHIRNCREWLEKVLLGKEEYPVLPILYSGGFISMDAIRAATNGNKFFRSCIPDVYSAVILSNTLDQYAFCDEPLAVNGASKHSTGTSHFSDKSNNGEPRRKFLQEGNIPFHPSIPIDEQCGYPKSIQAMLFESCAQAREVLQDALTLDPWTQLKVILATAGPYRASIERWAKKFAELHNLDFEQALAKSKHGERSYQRQKFYKRLKTFADLEITNEKQPIDDVFRASLAADEAIRSRTSLYSRMTRRLTNKVIRLLQRNSLPKLSSGTVNSH